MSPLRQRMLDDMCLRHFAKNTVRAYLNAVEQFTRHFMRSPDQLTADDARQFLLYLVQDRHMSWSSYNVIRAGLLFFFRITLGREITIGFIPCARRRRRLPTVLSKEEVLRLFSAARNHKHRVMMMILYGAGLRVSELCGLCVKDIDSSRMVLRIRQGKGNKERYAKLSPQLLNVLREYYREYKPADWLFPGRIAGQPITRMNVGKLFESVRKRAGLGKNITPHTLRHSYASHMLDAGADLRTIQVLLGHQSITSTAIYMHVSQAKVQAAPNPLDNLYASPVVSTEPAADKPAADATAEQ